MYLYVTAELVKLPEDASFEQKVRVATVAHLYSLVWPEMRYFQVYYHLPPIQKWKSRKMRSKYAKLWFDIFADGVMRNSVDANVNLKFLVPCYLSALNRVPEWIHASSSIEDDVAALVVVTLLDGVGIRRTPASATVLQILL